MIPIYERNLWKDIITEQHPRYIALDDFTVTLVIQEGKCADALEEDPVLHQKLIDEVNAFVNEKTYRFLSDKVFKTELQVTMHINNRNFDALAAEYRSFDEYTCYLLSLTNDYVKHLIPRTVDAWARDKKAVGMYKAGVGVQMALKIAGIGFSCITLGAGTASAIFSGGTTAIPGLIIGFVGLCQSTCELSREIVKAVETLEMARIDALASLKNLEKKYAGATGGTIGTREVLRGTVNKVFSGFVEIDTITTLSGKFDLWKNKILVLDQKSHKLARNLNKLLQKADELSRNIAMVSRPPVPSREGCRLKVPPPIPSRTGRPAINTLRQHPPPVPSRQGRINANAYRDLFAKHPAPPIPSRFGRPPAPAPAAPQNPASTESVPETIIAQKSKKTHKLECVRRSVMKVIPKIERFQAEVNINKKQNATYTKALEKLSRRKPRAAEFIQTFENAAIDLTKAGISLGLGGQGLYDGLSTAKSGADTLHAIGSFIVENAVESVNLSIDLTEGMGELGKTLKEKDRIDRSARI